MLLQQGDVLIKKVKSVPQGAKALKPGKRGHMLAEGETTGHAHTIEDIKYSSLFLMGTVKYLEVKEPVEIKHEEHKSFVIEPGIYEIGIVQEYDHFLEEARKVRD
jgi:hypothetical protein